MTTTTQSQAMSEADWSLTPPRRSPSHLLPPDQLLNHLNSQSPSPSPSSSPAPQWREFPSPNHTQSSQGALRVAEHEKLECIRYCVGNQDEYRALPRFQFWNNFKSWFEETFGRPLKQPDRMISQLVRKYQEKNNAIREESGTARSVTVLDQALDEWIQILDDLEAAKRLAKEDAAAAEENHLESGTQSSDIMQRLQAALNLILGRNLDTARSSGMFSRLNSERVYGTDGL
ncbi:hypothetical protein ACJ73_00610 [Blastomyces percursus]|uniref:Uncharacterized protein n=1 Tax=Blastomyces percursus TaxID=1658174 RepID=A0A1J9QHM3_9EURO|nr:hypothetical protein ACJ73_00610 [Blastomyces percursus]